MNEVMVEGPNWALPNILEEQIKNFASSSSSFLIED